MEPSAPPARPPSARRRWVGFFVVLGLLAAVAATVPVVVNLRQQLRPGQLEEARARWREHGPKSYDLEYTVKFDSDPVPERYLVLVRDGRTAYAARDGEVLHLDPGAALAAGLPPRALAADGVYGVEAVFARIEEVLSQDAEAGRRNFASALFDAQDGHPTRFVYRVRGTGRREEWNVLLSPPGGAGRRGKATR
jgi:hypothetical protein